MCRNMAQPALAKTWHGKTMNREGLREISEQVISRPRGDVSLAIRTGRDLLMGPKSFSPQNPDGLVKQTALHRAEGTDPEVAARVRQLRHRYRGIPPRSGGGGKGAKG